MGWLIRTALCNFEINIPEPLVSYTAEVVVWSQGYDERFGDDGGYARIAFIANPYEEGDTWYRDMRTPGFGATSWHLKSEDSLEWLARKIVANPRFAEATVKFWWPVIMGSEIAEPPAEEGRRRLRGAASRRQYPERRDKAAGGEIRAGLQRFARAVQPQGPSGRDGALQVVPGGCSQ